MVDEELGDEVDATLWEAAGYGKEVKEGAESRRGVLFVA